MSNVTRLRGAALALLASAASFSLCIACQCRSRDLAHGSGAYSSKSPSSGASRLSLAWSTVPCSDVAFHLVILSTSAVEKYCTAATTLSIAEQGRHNITMFHVWEDGYLFANAGHQRLQRNMRRLPAMEIVPSGAPLNDCNLSVLRQINHCMLQVTGAASGAAAVVVFKQSWTKHRISGC